MRRTCGGRFVTKQTCPRHRVRCGFWQFAERPSIQQENRDNPDFDGKKKDVWVHVLCEQLISAKCRVEHIRADGPVVCFRVSFESAVSKEDVEEDNESVPDAKRLYIRASLSNAKEHLGDDRGTHNASPKEGQQCCHHNRKRNRLLRLNVWRYWRLSDDCRRRIFSRKTRSLRGRNHRGGWYV
jgi:hypothetical protein